MKKIGHKLLIGLFLFAFTLISVSANGLISDGGETITVNKTYSYDKYVNITIKNSELFDFFNISFEDNPYIQIIEIPKLIPGQNITVEAKVVTDEDINVNLRLKGFYETQIGASNEVHYIDVTYDSGVSRCDFTVIKGDKISWENKDSYDFLIRNAQTFDDIKLLKSNDIYELILNEPGIFNYYMLRDGFIMSNTVCEVTILDDSGVVNNPEYDIEYNLIVDVQYPETTILNNMITRDYEISFVGSTDDLMSIRNAGNIIAKDIQLSGEWMSFSINNFDLEPGQSKNVGYTISPSGYIITTEGTNKTYYLNMSIKGNFQEIIENISVFIPFSDIGDSSSMPFDYEDIKKYIEYCTENPDDVLCPTKETVYVFTNKSGDDFNYTMSQEQLTNWIKSWFEFQGTYDDYTKYQKEALDSFNGSLTTMQDNQQLMTDDIDNVKDETIRSNDVIGFFGMVIGTVILLGGGGWFVYKERSKRQNKKWSEYK